MHGKLISADIIENRRYVVRQRKSKTSDSRLTQTTRRLQLVFCFVCLTYCDSFAEIWNSFSLSSLVQILVFCNVFPAYSCLPFTLFELLCPTHTLKLIHTIHSVLRIFSILSSALVYRCSFLVAALLPFTPQLSICICQFGSVSFNYYPYLSIHSSAYESFNPYLYLSIRICIF